MTSSPFPVLDTVRRLLVARPDVLHPWGGQGVATLEPGAEPERGQLFGATVRLHPRLLAALAAEAEAAAGTPGSDAIIEPPEDFPGVLVHLTSRAHRVRVAASARDDLAADEVGLWTLSAAFDGYRSPGLAAVAVVPPADLDAATGVVYARLRENGLPPADARRCAPAVLRG